MMRFGAFGLFGAVAALAVLCTGEADAAEAPKRVVSMNVCTDQLAMLIAGKGQLHSVSDLAIDPLSSTLADEAKGYVINHGLAEEVFLMHPDLVLAGTYTTRSTVALLRRLGIPVEDFAPEASLDDIRTNIVRMGNILGRQDRAAELLAEFDLGLSALAADRTRQRTVALYYANSYTSGAGTLVDAVVRAAGLINIADRLGLAGTVKLQLEFLILAAPDILVGGVEDYGRPAMAEENFMHPAYRALLAKSQGVSIPSAYTLCGTPYTLEAARRLQSAAHMLEGRAQ